MNWVYIFIPRTWYSPSMWKVLKSLFGINGSFPQDPVVETPGFHCKGAQVQSLVRELGFHIPTRCMAKKKKKQKKCMGQMHKYKDNRKLNVTVDTVPQIACHECC